MLPLSEELAQAERELRTWAHLHKTDDDTDLGVWRALVTVSKAVNALRKMERKSTTAMTHEEQP